MRNLLLCLVCCVLCFSCGENHDIKVEETPQQDSLPKVEAPKISKEEAVIIEPVADDEILVLENKGIKLTEIKADNNSNISIKLQTKQFKEGKNQLVYDVKGIDDYQIATIENNYTLNYFNQNIFDKEFLYGNNVFLSFLTHPNKISVKTNKANVLKNVVIGDMESLFNMKQPHLFYYLPIENTTEPILDFYLVNTSIAKDGNKVKVMINDNAEFLLEKWAAYKISGLSKSENTIRIQLLDKRGNLIEGPFNDSGERFFMLSEDS